MFERSCQQIYLNSPELILNFEQSQLELTAPAIGIFTLWLHFNTSLALHVKWNTCGFPDTNVHFPFQEWISVRVQLFISVELQLLYILWDLWLKSDPHKSGGGLYLKVDEVSVFSLDHCCQDK